MVKAIGFAGLKEFRNAVIVEIAKSEETTAVHQPMYGFPLEKEDRPEDVPKKIVTTTARVLEDNLKNISIKTYKKIIEILNHARMIDIYSVENSNVAARDLLTKLLYLGLNCRHMDDDYHQRIVREILPKKMQQLEFPILGVPEIRWRRSRRLRRVKPQPLSLPILGIRSSADMRII